MPPDFDAIAADILAALAGPHQIAPPSRAPGGLDAVRALAVADRVRAGLGGTRVGRKVGFTNASLWEPYGVDGPIWGEITGERLLTGAEPVALAPVLEPRIEPEIVLGLGRAPQPGMDRAALAACIDWVAPGFEIVESIYPGWSFSGPDTIAAQGLHRCLVLGRRLAATPDRLAGLAQVPLDLRRGGEAMATGIGANVLGGPLEVLAHLVGMLDPAHALSDGEMISTGTLTDALRIAPGETWSASYGGVMEVEVRIELVREQG